MNSEDCEMRAKVQLVKAYMQAKNNLNYQVNQLKIKNSYRQSNTDFRDFKDMATLTKILQKKLEEVKGIHAALISPDVKKMPIGSVNKLLDIILHSEGNIGEINDILHENLSSERYLALLQEKYSHLEENKQAKLQKFEYNNSIISKNSSKMETLNALEEEICDYKTEVDNYRRENENLSSRQKRIKATKRKSVDRIRIFHQLSDNALKLRSKLLFREELKSNIKNAELEIDFHFQKVSKEKQRLQDLEIEAQENLKYAAKYESDLQEMKEKIESSQEKLEKLKKEREILINKSLINVEKEEALKNPEKIEGNAALSLSSLIAGFSEMRKEKNSLIEENNLLKQRIFNLIHTKV